MDIFLIIALLFSNPTKEQIAQFLLDDNTNLIPYSADFDCQDFTETLVNNAYGFDAYAVGVALDNNGVVYHMFVGFETDDGEVWVEPQNDRFYIVSDKELCYENGECVGKLMFISR